MRPSKLVVLRRRVSRARSLPAFRLIGFDDPGPTASRRCSTRALSQTVRPEPGETAMVLYTSGSIGPARRACRSRTMVSSGRFEQRIRAGTFTRERLLIAAPLFHMNGLGTASSCSPQARRVVLLPRFEARRYIEAIGRFQCTWLTGVPTMFALIVRERETLARFDLSARQVRAHGLRAGHAAADRRHQGMFSGRVDLARLRHDRSRVRSRSARIRRAIPSPTWRSAGRRRASRCALPPRPWRKPTKACC